jgi:hypothetical protein
MLTNVFDISHLVQFSLTTLYTGRLGPIQGGENRGGLAERKKFFPKLRAEVESPLVNNIFSWRFDTLAALYPLFPIRLHGTELN